MDIHGKCVGVRITPRKEYGPLVQLLIEDDGNWLEKDFIISTAWLDYAIAVLQQARQQAIVKKHYPIKK